MSRWLKTQLLKQRLILAGREWLLREGSAETYTISQSRQRNSQTLGAWSHSLPLPEYGALLPMSRSSKSFSSIRIPHPMQHSLALSSLEILVIYSITCCFFFFEMSSFRYNCLVCNIGFLYFFLANIQIPVSTYHACYFESG